MPDVNCKQCGSIFYVRPSHQLLGWGKFCSVICKNLFVRKGHVHRCYQCNKNVYKSPAQELHSVSGKFFCDKKCQTSWRNSLYSREKHWNWKGGLKIYREILKGSKKKPECILCGIKNSRVLVAHHIDHNRSNNTLDNLIWVCLNCHFLIHHTEKLDQYVRSVNH